MIISTATYLQAFAYRTVFRLWAVKELAGVEAAVSDEFIGANIKIIGIRFGVIYYWGKNVSFGKNVRFKCTAAEAKITQ